MKNSNMIFYGNGISPLTKDDEKMINGGTLLLTPPFIAIGAIAGAAIAIYEFGKITGNFIYQLTH